MYIAGYGTPSTAGMRILPATTAVAAGSTTAATAMEVEVTGLSAEASAQFDATAKALSKGRKKRAMPAGYPDAAAIAAYAQVGRLPKAHAAGPACLDSHPNQPLVASGGSDGSVVVASASASGLKKAVGFSSGSAQLSCLSLHPSEDLLLASSHDGSSRLHTASTGETKHTLQVHGGAVTGCTLQATGAFAVTASADRTWALLDLATGRCLIQNRDDALAAGYSGCAFHPDGLIRATPTGGVVRVWECKSQTNAANFEGHTGTITCLAFSENGYHLATGGSDRTVKLWDLRKLTNFKTLELSAPVASVAFDSSGSVLAVGSAGLEAFETKSWASLASYDGTGAGAVTGLGFGAGGATLACATAAGVVALYGAK